MFPMRGKRLYISLAAAGLLSLGGAGVATASYLPFTHGYSAAVNSDACANDTADTAAGDETQDADNVQNMCGDLQAGDSTAQSGTIDDGKELLPQATLTVEQAISAAQAVATGSVGEIDLEHADGRLVFNIEIGNQDVKIDAADGSVVGMGED
jgi:uncharacterized membrane protein YkoI